MVQPAGNEVVSNKLLTIVSDWNLSRLSFFFMEAKTMLLSHIIEIPSTQLGNRLNSRCCVNQNRANGPVT